MPFFEESPVPWSLRRFGRVIRIELPTPDTVSFSTVPVLAPDKLTLTKAEQLLTPHRLVVSQFEFCPTLHLGKTRIRKLDGIVIADLQPTVLNCVFEASLKFCCRPTGLSEGKIALLSHKHVIWTTVL
jgi:hypothetical protein